MKEQADKIMLMFAFIGLLGALWVFQGVAHINDQLVVALAGVVGAICNMAQGKPAHPAQQNTIRDSTVNQPVAPEAPKP